MIHPDRRAVVLEAINRRGAALAAGAGLLGGAVAAQHRDAVDRTTTSSAHTTEPAKRTINVHGVRFEIEPPEPPKRTGSGVDWGAVGRNAVQTALLLQRRRKRATPAPG
jgi:hypothetical protein